MSPKRGDRVAPPAAGDEWDLLFGSNEAAKGWADLCQHAAANTLEAWRKMRTDPRPARPTERQHQLKGGLSMGSYRGVVYDQWQIEVTGGGRVWYLIDERNRRVILKYAGTGHPKATD